MPDIFENFDHHDKEIYEMHPECFSCILNVSIGFLDEGLQLLRDKNKIRFFSKRLLDKLDPETEQYISKKLHTLESNLELKEEIKKEGIKELVKHLATLLDYPYPVIIASEMFQKVKEITHNDDPWKDLKAISTLICLGLEDQTRDFIFGIEEPKERLRAALIFAAIANTIDFGTAMHKPDFRLDFDYLMEKFQEFTEHGFAIDDYDDLYDSLLELTPPIDDSILFDEEDDSDEDDSITQNIDNINDLYDEVKIKLHSDLDKVDEEDNSDKNPLSLKSSDEEDKYYKNIPGVLLLLDNAGEIVFDKILAEVLVGMGLPVIAVVKGGAVSNDATLEDTDEIEFDKVCPVISTGSADLGFNPYRASKEFLSLIDISPVVIAKGQANFESINTFREFIPNPKLYLLAKFKCEVNATIAGVQAGEYVLWKMQD